MTGACPVHHICVIICNYDDLYYFHVVIICFGLRYHADHHCQIHHQHQQHILGQHHISLRLQHLALQHQELEDLLDNMIALVDHIHHLLRQECAMMIVLLAKYVQAVVNVLMR